MTTRTEPELPSVTLCRSEPADPAHPALSSRPVQLAGRSDLAAVLDGLGDAVVAIDLNQRVTYMNRAAEERYQVESRGVLGQSLSNVYTWQWLRPEDEAEAEVALRERGRWRGLNVHTTRDGRRFVVESTVAAMHDANGRPSGLVATIRDITRQHRAEDALREAHQRLRHHLQNTPLAVVEFDPQLRITAWSDGAQRIFGWKASEVLGREMWQVPWICDEDREQIKEVSADMTARQSPRTISPNRNLRKDGSVLWCEWYNSALTDAAGKLVSIQSLVLDVTDRKQAEESLRQATERYALLSETAGLLLKATEPRSVVEELCRKVMRQINCDVFFNFLLNDRSGRLHLNTCDGITAEQAGRAEWLDLDGAICGTAVLDRQCIVSEDVASTDDPRLERIRSYGVLAYCVHPLILADRVIGTLSFGTRSRSRFTSEELELMHAVANQVAVAIERTQTEKALRESEEKFRALADNITQLAWMADETGAIFWYNRRWYEYTGTTFQEMEGWGWQKVHHPEYLEPVTEKFRRHIQTGEIWEDTFPLRGRDGRYGWFLSRAVPIRDTTGRIIRWFGTNTDITTQREAEQALAVAKEAAEQASKAKDHFLAVLSHELRTPLTPVLMSVAERLRNPGLPKALREDLEMIHRNVELETRLIDDLLDITRIARGKMVLQPAPLDLRLVIAHAADTCLAEARGKGLELVVTLGADPLPVLGDAARLQQIFWNLIKNAVKFTSAGQVRVRCTVHEGRVIVVVEDDGIGMEADLVGRVFDAFEQGGVGTTRKFGGLGLGLAICKAIAEMHGGTIVAASAGRGHGSAFTVTLPLTVGEAISETAPALPVETEPQRPGESSPASRPCANVLLVEDHDDSARMLARLLRKYGHRVKHAGDVATALRMADAERFDILISDIGLPDGTGLDLMRQLGMRHPHLCGIALSGHGMESDLQMSRQAGFSAHVVKPVDPRRLDQAIADLLAG